ncbi:MAG: 5-(carboxyamino)imidazole ribonucleotide mutase [Pseudomonadota bacterium]|nr:5-(carboxyamino)imidazole ribonucleotide mutase [Pseudomonadota bacterium]MEC9392091.1 5-(carboxyamino)imidazole ribonucleotide mutase [Pseudomonadota bacterium]
MGSQSDWSTMKAAADFLTELNIPYEKKVVSAHRTPDRLYSYAKNAKNKGIRVIIAGAGGAAHLPGMIASLTSLPVLGVPIESKTLKGIDSLLSIAQMPAGIPVGTLAIGVAGAKNSAILALSIISLSNKTYSNKLEKWKKNLTDSVPISPEDE